MSIYELTEAKEVKSRVEVTLNGDGPTADLVEYGLRDGGGDAEYFLAARLQKLRCVAIELIQRLEEEGYMVDPLHLSLIDIQAEIKSTKRLTL